MRLFVPAALVLAMSPTAASAAEISTHVLDLARGVGRKDVPVTLSRRSTDGRWTDIASARTDGDGRIRSFGDRAAFPQAIYRLTFDMSAYPGRDAAPFFPEIVLTFRVTDTAGHYHVPVVVSPFGYSTYRGN